MIQNVWDAAKAVLRGMFIVIQAYLRNKKNLKQPNLHLKKLEKEQSKPTVRRNHKYQWINTRLKTNRKDQ